MGEKIAFGSTRGYLARPDQGAGPAVIVIGGDRELCDLLAGEGFTALALEPADGPPEDRLAAAVDLLKPHPAVRGHGIGVVGCSDSAPLVRWLALHRPEDVAAVVTYSGTVNLDAAAQDHLAEGPFTREAWIRTLEFLRKHLG